MEGCIIEANNGGKGQGWLPIPPYTLYWDFKIIPFALQHWDFKIIPFTLYTYVLTKILQNGAKFIPKKQFLV